MKTPIFGLIENLSHRSNFEVVEGQNMFFPTCYIREFVLNFEKKVYYFLDALSPQPIMCFFLYVYVLIASSNSL